MAATRWQEDAEAVAQARVAAELLVALRPALLSVAGMFVRWVVR